MIYTSIRVIYSIRKQAQEGFEMTTKEVKDLASRILKANGIDEKITIKQAKQLIRQADAGLIPTDEFIPYEARELAWEGVKR